ncbi:hypothetical protein BCL76_105353 [Streptomyces sp. CG 926]|nr:hypothetical protein BCL76_105353 [Streptomyces sp. CG 926]
MVSQTRDHAPRNTVRHRSAKRDPHRDDEGTAFVKLARHILGRAPSLRVPAYGAQAALLVYLGFAWMINSISLATAAGPSA